MLIWKHAAATAEGRVDEGCTKLAWVAKAAIQAHLTALLPLLAVELVVMWVCIPLLAMNPLDPIATRVTSTPSTDNKDAYIESIKRDLLAAENTAKAARHALRAWNREVRKVALEFAPEMFLVLPDPLAPGSVLGDGGFVNSLVYLEASPGLRNQLSFSLFANIVFDRKRNRGGWDWIFSIARSEQAAESNLRWCASGTENVPMHDDRQRKALERELSILGRLKTMPSSH